MSEFENKSEFPDLSKLSLQDVGNLETIRMLSRKSLYFFSKFVLHYPFFQRQPHLPLCNFLQCSLPSKRITMMRGGLKSTICSHALPIWLSCLNPNIRILIVSNTSDNAEKFLNGIRQHWERNTTLRALYPHLIPTSRRVRWTDSCAVLNRTAIVDEGTYETAGVSSTITSRHYDVIIVDDPVRAQVDNATGMEFEPDPDDIEKANRFISLLDNLFVLQRDKVEIHVGTRWALHDVVEWLVKEERCQGAWEVAAVDESGTPTYPWKYPLDVLANIRKGVGDYMYETQYMNRPRAQLDQIFATEKLLHWSTLPHHSDLGVVMAVDPASSKKASSDFTALVVVALDRKHDNWYILEAVHDKWSPSETLSHIFQLNERWHPQLIGIETILYQEALRDFAEKHARAFNIYLPVRSLHTSTRISKEQRIKGLQPRFMRNNTCPSDTTSGIFLAPGMNMLRTEIIEFPQGRHEDILDALAYCQQLLPNILSTPTQVKSRQRGELNLGRLLEEHEQKMSSAVLC